MAFVKTLSKLIEKLQTKEKTDKPYYTEIKGFVIPGYHQATAKSSGGKYADGESTEDNDVGQW